jgi:hypothetical protein
MGVFAGNAGAQRGYIGIGAGTNSATYSTAIGNGSPTISPGTNGAQATGIYSIAIGGGDHPTDRPAALADNTFGVAVGTGAVAKGVRSTSIGAFAGYNPLGAGNNRNSSFGEEAGQSVNGGGNTAVGLASGVAVTGDLNSSLGNSSGITVTGNSNTTAGVSSGVNINGSSNAAYGDRAGRDVTGSANIAIGHSAGGNINASHTIAMGTSALASVNASIAIGIGARATRKRAIAIGSGSIANVADVVSFGHVGGERRIINVAPAINGTDAVNLAQVQALIGAAPVTRGAVALLGRGGGSAIVSRDSVKTTTRRSGSNDIENQSPGTPPATSGPNGRESGAQPRSAAGMQSAAATPVMAVTCETSGAKVTTAIDDDSTSSPSFLPIAQTGISFQQGGTTNGCVNLSFSAESLAPGATLMEVRAVLNGSVEASPGRVYFAQGDDVLRSHAFNFLFPNVPPGPHRVEVHFRSTGEPGTVRVGMRTTMVHYVR